MRARDSSFLHVLKGRHNNNKKKEGEKRHTKNKRERERERDDFLVLFCDHEDGDGWDDREE